MVTVLTLTNWQLSLVMESDLLAPALEISLLFLISMQAADGDLLSSMSNFTVFPDSIVDLTSTTLFRSNWARFKISADKAVTYHFIPSSSRDFIFRPP